MVVAQPPGQHAGGVRVRHPLAHTFGVAQCSQPFQQVHKALAPAPVALAKGVAQVLAARLGAVVVGSRFTHGKQQVTQGRSRKRVRPSRRCAAPAHIGANLACSTRSVCANSYQNASTQGAGAGHAGAVGLVAFEQGFDIGYAKATRQLFVHALAALAPAFNVERAQVVALHQAQVSPGVFQTAWDERVAGNAQGALDALMSASTLAFDRFMDLDGRVAIDYGVYGVPETYIIDKAGIIRLKHIGPVTPEVYSSKILPLVAELNK